MNKTARSFLPLVVVLFSIPALASSRYRLEFFAAGNMPQEKKFEIAYPQSTVPMKGTYEWSPGARGGIRFGSDYQRHWGGDFEYSYGANATRILNHYNGGRFGFTVHSHQFSYNLIWYPRTLDSERRVFPYFSGGAGTTFYQLSPSTTNEALDPNRAGLGKLRNESIFTYNVGGGLRFRINSVWGLRLEVRDYISAPPRYGLPETSDDANQIVFPVHGQFHQIQASVAFVYYFK
jgi:hypothetical protein